MQIWIKFSYWIAYNQPGCWRCFSVADSGTGRSGHDP